MADLAYRAATVGEAADIFTVLEEVAAEIPLLLDTLERQEALYALVRNWARSGQSWLAVDAAGRIVGFVLVEQHQAGRFWGEHEVLDIRYAGVAKDHRNQGICRTLIRHVLDRVVPVTVTVVAANQSGMDRRLERLGFRRTRAGTGEQQFRWDPGERR